MTRSSLHAQLRTRAVSTTARRSVLARHLSGACKFGGGLCARAVATPSRAPAQARASRAAAAEREDPAPGIQPPGSMQEVAIQSHGSRMNGIVYLAAGAGSHPLVIFLHG